MATWLVAIPLAFVNPAAGVCFWIWDALFSPTELAYSFMSRVGTDRLIAVCTLLAAVMAARRYRIRVGAVGWLLAALVVVSTVSNAFPLVDDDLADTIYVKLLKEVVLAGAIVVVVADRRWLYMAALSIAVALGFMGVKEGLIAVLTAGGHQITGSRATGDNNQLAAALVCTIPMMYAIHQACASRVLKAGLVGSMVLTAVTVVMSFSRGGFVGLVVLALLYLKGSNRRLVAILSLLVVGALLFWVAPPAWFSRVDSINDAAEDSSFMGRVIAWKISFLIAEGNPFFGGGMHAVQQWTVWHRYAQAFSSLDFIPTSIPDVVPHAAHSIYFEVLGDLGFTGLAIYLSLMAVALLNCRAALRLTAAGSCAPVVGLIARSLSWSLICYMVTGALLSIAYYDLFFVLVALSASCRYVAVAEAAAPVRIPQAVVEPPVRQRVPLVGAEPRYRFGARGL